MTDWLLAKTQVLGVKRRCHFGNVIPASLILSCSSVALWQMIFPCQCRQNVRCAKLIKNGENLLGAFGCGRLVLCVACHQKKNCEMLLDLCDHLSRCKTNLNAPSMSIDELKLGTMRSSTAFWPLRVLGGVQKTLILVKGLIMHYDCVTAFPTFKC